MLLPFQFIPRPSCLIQFIFYTRSDLYLYFSSISKNTSIFRKKRNRFKKVPSGKTHDKINIVVLFLILLSLFSFLERSILPFPNSYLESRRIVLFSLAYLFGTFYLSPDLDIKSTPYRRWGILKVIWRPYQRLFKHRGILHHPVFGPVILTLTLLVLIYPLLYFLFIFLNIDTGRFPVWAGSAIFIGLVLSMEVHYLSDFVWSKIMHTKR